MNPLHCYKIYIFSFVLFLLPSLFYVTFHTTSMAIGLFCSILFVFIFSSKKLPRINIGNSLVIMTLVVFFLFHLITSCIFFPENFTVKCLLSFFLINFFLFCAALISVKIKNIKHKYLIYSFKSLSYFFVALGLFSLFYRFNFFGYDKFAKSIFPFAEPSHYAINSGFALFVAGFYMSSFMQFFLICIVFIMGTFQPSVILLLIALMMSLFYFVSSPRRLYFYFISIAVFGFVYIHYSSTASYFIERLTFINTSQNLTALVYMQGWEQIKSALFLSDGFGVGFQNLGNLPVGDYGESIFRLAGHYKNREDGSFLAAKIIAEFGILGIFFVLLYLMKLIHSVRYIVHFVRSKHEYKYIFFNQYPVPTVLGHSVIIFFFIEMFARGYGYFSSGLFMLFVALFLTIPTVSGKRFLWPRPGHWWQLSLSSSSRSRSVLNSPWNF